MAFGTGFFAALSGVPGGILEGEERSADIARKRAASAEAQNDVMGRQAFGRALQLMYGGAGVVGAPGQSPGAGQPPGGAGAPPGMTPPRPPGMIPNVGPPSGAPPGSPPPGPQPLTTDQLTAQPSPMAGSGPGQGVSDSRFNQTFMQPLIPPQGEPGATPGQPGGAPGSTITGGTPGAPPSGPPGGPSPGGQPPMQPGGRPGMPGGQAQPALTLESVMQAMIRANPGAPPQVIAAGVNRFLPMMNAQSQMQWREISLQLREQTLQNAMTRFQQGEERRNRQGEERTEDRRRGLDIRETGEERRGQESTSRQTERQRRGDIAETREQRLEREGRERASDRGARTDLARQREERQAAESKERLTLIKEKVTQAQAQAATKKLESDYKLKKLKADADAAIGKKNLQEARLKLQAMHQRSAELINEWALAGKIDPKARAAVIEENRLLYRKMIDDMGKPQPDKTEVGPEDTRQPDVQTNAPKQLRINPASGQLEEMPAGVR